MNILLIQRGFSPKKLSTLLAAAVVIFFLEPLRRFADRIAGAAITNTRETPEYVAFRKMQVCEEAVAEAHCEGGIMVKERALPNRLRHTPGISVVNAEAIEREVTAPSVAAS